jgi:toxin ParE1/3/4
VQVEWQPEARRDLIAILDYISDRNLGAAAALEARVMACVDRLPEFPALYRVGRVAETREAIVHPNYILIYKVLPRSILILRVLHARQQYP